MKRLKLAGLFAAVALVPCGSAAAQPSPDAQDVYVVSHIDIAPKFVPGETITDIGVAITAATKQALVLLADLAASCHRDANCRSFDILEQVDAPNHFTLVQHWTSADAFDAHEAASEVRDIRAKLQPILGSPFDERVHQRLD